MSHEIDYIRVIGAEEFRHRHEDVMITPLGGAVLIRRNSSTAWSLFHWSTGSIDGNACLQPEAMPTVHPGLKAEVLYSVGMYAEARGLLESSKRALDYALALVGVHPYGEWRVAELQEFQTLARSIAAAMACLSVLEEFGLTTPR